MQQEDDVHDRDDDRFLDQRPPQRVRGPFDERRPIVERHDLHPGRQAGLQGLDLVFHPIDDVDGTHAVPRDHDATDGLVGPLHQRGGAKGIAHLHVRNLSDENRDAVLGADDHVLEIAHALDQAETAHDRPRAARLDHVATHVAVAPHHRIDNGRERDLVGAQPVRVDVDLVLANQTADAGDLRHARHRVELIADEPILDRPQIAQRVSPALDGVPEDMADARGIGPERRHRARRERFGQQVQAFEHARAREVEIDVVLEDDVDHREAERRRGPDHAHTGQALQAHRQRIGDLVLDLLRGTPRPVGEDDDLVIGEVRDGVDRRRQERPVAPDADEREEGDDEKPVAQRDLDEPIDHRGGAVPTAGGRSSRRRRPMSTQTRTIKLPRRPSPRTIPRTPAIIMPAPHICIIIFRPLPAGGAPASTQSAQTHDGSTPPDLKQQVGLRTTTRRGGRAWEGVRAPRGPPGPDAQAGGLSLQKTPRVRSVNGTSQRRRRGHHTDSRRTARGPSSPYTSRTPCRRGPEAATLPGARTSASESGPVP